MPLSLEQLMSQLASYFASPLDVVRDVFTIQVPLPSQRMQYVSATLRADTEGRQIIDFVSTVGQVRGNTDPWHLLTINDKTLFCRVAVVKGMIFVVASQLLETAQPQEVLLILREVALTADQLEAHLIGEDTN